MLTFSLTSIVQTRGCGDYNEDSNFAQEERQPDSVENRNFGTALIYWIQINLQMNNWRFFQTY